MRSTDATRCVTIKQVSRPNGIGPLFRGPRMATATDDRPITDDEIFQALEMDFEPREIHQKPNGRGGSFPYIKAPSVRRRLNQVVGRANWETKIQIVQQSAVCSLTIHLPSGRSITRCGVGHIGRNDKEDVVYKGAATDAL